ncbi:Protein btn-1 [Lachnellula suecica]|uniref:Protein BTN n=1 Tax=Lachnellula suecica TaxID=602035 RepID=A0A8T9BVU9_9HELO|nr:Protein btn-1 [Lachnellula suecica]
MMSRSPSSSGLLPLPGAPGSSWALYKARFKGLFQGADSKVLVAFWLFGLINNVSYVIILTAALDLVGTSIPKSLVLLLDVVPSFTTKLVAPYFIHHIPYSTRILAFTALSAGGMFLIALTPDSIPIKLFGVALASVSAGGGELSFLGLTHYYGPFSLAAWGSGTGGAGLVGAGLYVFLTSTLALSVKTSLLTCAFLPFIMLLAFFIILPLGPLRCSSSKYAEIPSEEAGRDEDYNSDSEIPTASATQSLLPSSATTPTLFSNLKRARALFLPYMLPLLLVYIAEYTINQGISPTLLFPLASSPFSSYRQFYPTYNLIYQTGVFVARSSTPFIRLHNLYLPSFLQCGNLLLLLCQSLFWFLPSVWIVMAIIFWEGLLGGAVYVNTFAEIMENVPREEREFSLGATSVADSAGICVAGFVGMWLEGALCGRQVEGGRDWCTKL